MKKTLTMGLIAAIITIAMIPSMTFSVTNAFAQTADPGAAKCDDPPCGDRSDNSNNFGEGASDAGKAGKMGDHSSNPPDIGHDLTPDRPGRAGIGELGFPGDVADSLGSVP